MGVTKPVTSTHHVWRVSGKEPLSLLEDTTSQHLDDLPQGSSAWTCILDPNGRVLSFMRVSNTAQGVLLDGEPASSAGVDWIASISRLSGCEISRVPEFHVMRTQSTDPPADAIASSPRADGLEGLDYLVEATEVVPPSDSQESERIKKGWPKFGIDVTPDHILNDTPFFEIATSLTKGCYRGQETVAKINNLGHARRMVARLEGPADGAPSVGEDLFADEKKIGTVTSLATHGDKVFALATMKVELDGTTLEGQWAARAQRIRLASFPETQDRTVQAKTLRLGMKP